MPDDMKLWSEAVKTIQSSLNEKPSRCIGFETVVGKAVRNKI